MILLNGKVIHKIISIVMIYDFFSILYLTLPAFVANMIPIVAAKANIFSGLNTPIDRGIFLRKKRLLGDNKTIRGLLVGTFAGSATSLIQYFLPIFPDVLMSTALVSIGFGACAGFGALVGDAVASFIKRQLNITSGKPCIPLDQIDYIIGFIIFTMPFFPWEAKNVIFLLIFALIANPLTNITAYVLGIKKTYW